MRCSSQKGSYLQRAILNRVCFSRSHGSAASAIAGHQQDAPINFKNKDYLYSTLLDGLQKPQDFAFTSPRTHMKPFYDIKKLTNEDEIKEYAQKRIPWSSSNDQVTRTPFAKDVVHLQTLLDALLASGNLQRAENILAALKPLVDRKLFSNSVNQYLQVYAQQDSTTIEDVDSFMSQMRQTYDVYPNPRTYALAISKALQENADYTKYIDMMIRKPHMMQNAFGNADLLSLDQILVIFKNPRILIDHVPLDLQSLYKEIRRGEFDEEKSEATPEYFTSKNTAAPVVKADTEEVRAVDSFGLTVIRHTLLGLESKESLNVNELFKNMDEDMSENVLHNSDGKRTNYYEIYRNLKTEEDRKKFNTALDMFNFARQKELESKGFDAAREKWKHEYEKMRARGDLSMNKSLNAQLYQWYLDIIPLVEKEMELCSQLLKDEADISALPLELRNQLKERATYAPYFVLLPAKQLAVITLLELLKLNSTGGVVDGMRTARAVISVGKAVELEYRSKILANRHQKAVNMRCPKDWRKYIKSQSRIETPEAGNYTEWNLPTCAKLGSVLISMVMQASKVTVTGKDPVTGDEVKAVQPAFHHTYQFVNGQRLGVIRLHKKLVSSLAGNSTQNSVQPQLLPMLVAPRDWNKLDDGGYHFSHSHLVRVKDSAEIVAYVKAAAEAGDLDNVYKGLNVLGATPWTINAKILKIITHYWNIGEDFLDLPPVSEEPVLPAPLPFNAEPHEKTLHYKKVRSLLQEAATFRSQRCDSNYKLEIARAFVGEKMFFPHNIDFRGRAYPLSPHFNHLGNDMTRSLFLFWDGKELGEEGLRWLKIHLANLYGMDKAPLSEREAFVDQNMEQILKTAEDPYKEEKWWTKADKPWQVLSVCFELREAFKLEDPTKYRSHIPVHQDGTCNGLQHYAALGGDIEGARQVNLLPAERPLDVYKFVAGLVEKRLDTEAEAGNEYAKFLRGRISRKVVKQTVMTNVYGVTFVGAVAQIEKQMDGWFGKDDFKLKHAHSTYLTSLVFESMRELFEGAHLIQDWLGESAKRISKSVRTDFVGEESPDPKKPFHASSVVWTTPLSLPCVQPYRAVNKQIVSTNLQDITISDPFGAMQVDARKQATAFPPNYIHSLDATHMLMTSAACGDAGLHFASVHDSYWTHAHDVNKMNEIIRDQFVNLHKDNLIIKLREEFERRYKGFLLAVHIDGNHELAKKIRSVRRDIVNQLGRALTLADEIQIETKRQALLKSPSAQDNKLGQEMETTISVTEGYDIDSIKVKSSKGKAVQILVPLTFPDIPRRGDLDVEVVKGAPYFFS
ncbi:hypothetical protein PUMCH_001899 [Australozyma saopauloensis]|uniref:DNA-directed RNA polymerase n=1 Tax=Australozyma saopauloensis TaxID=291208 RepID=A0AAX4H7V3_9ASCO|nr:hypothetical protein PUMCH_001899 [[Candida] saopauloensis]